MRHVTRVIELVTWDLEHARRRERAEPELDRWIGRVHRDDAVDVELVVVDVGRERPDLHFPDAVLVLRHRVGLAVELADERDLFRVRCTVAQRDASCRRGPRARRPAARLVRRHGPAAPGGAGCPAAAVDLRESARSSRPLRAVRPVAHSWFVAFCPLYSVLVGPHPHSLSRGDFAPRSGRRRCR